MGIHVPEPLVQELLSHADMRLELDQRGLPKPDLPTQVVDRRLGLGDQSLLGVNLALQAGDQGVDGVDLRDRVADLGLDRVELVLVVDLLPDALVVGDTCLIHRRRVAGIAVDGRHVLHRLRHPGEGGQDRGKHHPGSHVRSSRSGGRRCSCRGRPAWRRRAAGPGRGWR